MKSKTLSRWLPEVDFNIADPEFEARFKFNLSKWGLVDDDVVDDNIDQVYGDGRLIFGGL